MVLVLPVPLEVRPEFCKWWRQFLSDAIERLASDFSDSSRGQGSPLQISRLGPRLLLLLIFAKHIFNCRHHWYFEFNCRHHWYFEILSVLTIMLQLAHVVLQGLTIDELDILLRVVIAAEPGSD